MYESQSYELILKRMLDRVPSDVDKREGSIIYDALAPAAVELAIMYVELDINRSFPFAETATGEYLDMRTKDYGVTRREATKAVLQGEFRNGANNLIDVPIGSRYFANGLNFTATERISLGIFELESETSGIAGNLPIGDLLPVQFVPGLASATITDILIPGTDAETDDQLRSRYFQTVRAPSTSGNKADYRKWALEVTGVGDAAVLPLWNGPGTVKVVVIDAAKDPASAQLVSDVQGYISPVSGAGEGQAPVGADVTVVAASGITINITASVILDGSRTLLQVNSDFEAAVSAYLKSIAFGVDPSVKIVRIGALLLDTPGVQDYTNLQLNGTGANITVAIGSVAVKGVVTLT